MRIMYTWRNFFCFLICIYLLAQSATFMVLLSGVHHISIVTALIPTYIYIFGVFFVFPVSLLATKNIKTFSLDNIAAFIVIIGLVLFTALGIYTLDTGHLGYLPLFLPSAIIFFLMAAYYICKFAAYDIPRIKKQEELKSLAKISHDFQ